MRICEYFCAHLPWKGDCLKISTIEIATLESSGSVFNADDMQPDVLQAAQSVHLKEALSLLLVYAVRQKFVFNIKKNKVSLLGSTGFVIRYSGLHPSLPHATLGRNKKETKSSTLPLVSFVGAGLRDSRHKATVRAHPIFNERTTTTMRILIPGSLGPSQSSAHTFSHAQ